MAREKNGAFKTSKINPDIDDRLNGDSFQLARQAFDASDEGATLEKEPTGLVMAPPTLGAIAFVGFNSDGADGFQFVVLTSIGAGEVIRFTDCAWNGTAFSSNETLMTWTAGAAGVAAGTVVSISGMGTATNGSTLTSSTGTTVISALGTLSFGTGLANANEVIYAFSGNLSGNTLGAGAVFLAAIGNSTTSTLSTWTAGAGGMLDNTGLSIGNTAIGIRGIATAPGSTGGTPPGTATVTDVDIAVFNGARTGQTSFAGYLASISNAANWIGEDGSNDQSANGVSPEAALNPTAFTVVTPGALAIDDVTHTEGNAGTTVYTFTVTRTGGTDGAVDATWTITFPGGADAGDFAGAQPLTGTVSFAAGSAVSQTITVNVAGDTTVEPDESFTVTLSAPTGGATISDADGIGTITNDDNAGALAINDVAQAEGAAGATNFTFTVSRTGGSSGAVGATYTLTLSGAAVAGDFTVFPQTGTVSFANGETSKTITITVQGDFNVELDELFTVVLSAPTGGATLADDTGQGTITNDDFPINGTPGQDSIGGTVGDDVINGLGGHDRLLGNAGNDTLNGGDGDDYISGGTSAGGGPGSDIIDGGAGFDRAGYFTNVGGVGVTVSLLLQGSAQNTGSQGMDTLTNIENLSGSVYADVLTGDNGNNWLWGSTANSVGNFFADNDDTISGMGGDDLITVGIGDHIADGGADQDTFRFTENGAIAEAGITVSLLLQGGAQASGYGSWTLSNFENLSGGQGGDTLTGDGNANRITGERGNDTISGGGGNDTLSGDLLYDADTHGTGFSGQASLILSTDEFGVADATGNDSLDGGAGDDTALYWFQGPGTLTIVGNAVRLDGVNVATIAYAGANVIVTGVGAGAHIGTDTLTGIEHIQFSIQGTGAVTYEVAYPAIIGGDDTGAVTEDGTLTDSGTLTIDDPDGADTFQIQTGATTTYGTFSIDADGDWSYALNNANGAVQALNTGQTLTDTITVLAADGTAHDIVVTINGTNEGGGNTLYVGVGGFATIQAAIDASQTGDTIVIADGTYSEQLHVNGKTNLTIRAEHSGLVTVLSPGQLAQNGYSDHYGIAVRAVIAVNDSTDVSIQGLVVDGNFSGDTTSGVGEDEISGIGYFRSSGSIAGTVIENVGNSVGGGLFGLQHGSGLFIDGEGGAGGLAVSVTGSTIRDFQKTGALVFGVELNFTGNFIIGIGATGLTAQNGLQIGNAEGVIDGNEISGFGYTGGGVYSSGIIAYEPSGALAITNNEITGEGPGSAGIDLSDVDGVGVTISGNDFEALDYGVYAYTYTGGGLGLDTAPDLSGNSFTDIGIEGLHIDPEESYGPGFTTSNPFNLTGTAGADTLAGSLGNDNLDGAGGNDILRGNGGDDTLTGNGGTDTAVYAGIRSGYALGVVTDANGRVTSFTAVDDTFGGNGDEGTDTLSGVEVLQFNGLVLNLADPVQLFDNNGVLVGTFTTIQAAVDAAGADYRIEVAAGIYVEQVVVDGKSNLTIHGADGATIQAPLDVHQTATSSSGRAVNALVTVTNGTNIVFDNINVDGAGHGNTVDGASANFIGVYYRNASGGLIGVDIGAIRDPYDSGTTLSGIQRGVGLQVDNSSLLAFTMTGGSIFDFQKNATVFNYAILSVTGVTVTGGGAQTINAQNGFQVSNSTGAISGNTITGIGYSGSQDTYSAGILAFGNTSLDILNNIITGANGTTLDAQVVGIYVLDFGTPNSGGTISGNTISYVDIGVAVYGDVQPNGITVGANDVTNIDTTDPYTAGVDFEPNPGLATAFDVTGTAGDDILYGAAGNDNLKGLGGNDDLMGNGGDDTLTGGAGSGDTAIYAGARSGYTYSYTTDAHGRATAFTGVDDINPVGGDEGTDTLSGVEVLQFLGQSLNVNDPVQLFDASNVLVGTFTTIQAAVDASSAGYTLRIAAGIYTENVNFHTAVTVLGAHSGDGGATRTGSNAAGETTLIGRHDITAATGAVTLDGLRFVNNGSTTGGGAGDPILQIVTGGGHVVTNSVFYSEVQGGNVDDRAISMSVIASGQITISDNYFTGAFTGLFGTASWQRAVWFDGGGVDLDVTGNTIQYTRSGLNLDMSGDSEVEVSGNHFTSVGSGVVVGVDMVGLTVLDNDFTNTNEEFNFRNLTVPVVFDAETAVDAQTGDYINVLGGQGGDTLRGTSGADILDGNQLNINAADGDTLEGRAGNDILFGRGGYDTAVFSGNRADYQVNFVSPGVVQVIDLRPGSPDGTDTLVEIERALFADEDYSIDPNTGVLTLINFAPVAVDDVDSAVEDGPTVSGSVAANDSDPDPGETATLSYTLDAPIAGLTLDLDGGYSFDPSDAAYQHLALGATVNVVAAYTVTDENGASDGGTLTITITGTNDAPVVTSGPAAASGAVTEGISLDNATPADQAANSRFEPSVNYDAQIVSLLAANPDDMPAVLAGLQALLPAGANGIADAIALIWDYVDDNYTYYDTVINEISARLSVEYARYLQGGGAPLTGVVAKYAADGGDVGSTSDRVQSMHDNLLGNLTGAGLNDKFRGPPNGTNPTPDETAYNQIIALLTTHGLSAVLDRPYYGGYEGDNAGPTLDFDRANNLLAPATGGTLTASDPDDGAVLNWSGSAGGTYGAFAITGGGVWSYTLDNLDPDTQALAQGATAIETFTATVTDQHGATATQLVTITITGTNDAPVARADVNSGAEDMIVTGSVAGNDSDVDSGAVLSYTLTAPVAGLTLDPNGSYTFDAGDAAYQHIAQGATQVVTAQYVVGDGLGGTSISTLTITLTGVNDAPVVTGTASGTAVEAISLDNATPANQAANNRFEPTVNYDAQIVSLLAAHNDDMPAVLSGLQALLPAGSNGLADAIALIWDYVDDNYTYYDTVINEISARLSVEYARYLVGGGVPLTGVVVKYAPDGGDGGSLPDRVQSMHDNLLGNLSIAGLNDKLRGPPNGTNPNPDETAYNQIIALLASHGLSDIVNRPYYGGSEGEPNPALAYDQAHGLQPVTGGTLTATDVDDDAVLTWSGSATGIYGSIAIAANGVWRYTLDNLDPQTQALAQGATAIETFTATVTDNHGATATQTVTITITGTNDAPVAQADVASGIEDGAPVSGSVATNDSDVDTGASLSYALAAPVAGLTLNLNGSYVFDPADAAYQHIAQGATQVVIAHYIVTDGLGGSSTSTLTITLTGTNDAPVVTGPVMASATEGGGLYTFNPLANASDPDDGDSLVVIPTGVLPAGVSFVGGSAATISFSDYALGSVVGQHGWTDGSPGSPDNEIVDVLGNRMLRLANDPTSGDFAGPFSPAFAISAGEGGAAADTLTFSFVVKAVNNVADGSRLEIDLGSSDRDDRYNFMALEHVNGGLRLVQNTPNADGVNWSSNDFDFGTGSVQLGALLNASVAHTITVVFRAVDGSNNDIVEYYVDGVLVGTGSTFENFAEFHLGNPHASAINSVNNVLFRAGDPAGNPFPADGPGGNRLGFYIDDLAMAAYDSHQLQFNANDPAYDHLAAGQIQLVTVNYNVADGHGGLTPASTVITVTGTNDGATITGVATGAVVESGVGPGMTPNPGTPTATGTLSVSDVDDGESELLPIVAGTAGANGYGTFEVLANGQWTYTLNNGDADTNALYLGQVVTDTITVYSEDLTDSQVITVTITGTNDAPVVSGPVMVSATEGGGTYTFNPLANASDPDAGDGLVVIPISPLPAGVSFVSASSLINFDDYALGSVVGQFGWTDSSPTSPDNAIVDLGAGDKVLWLANDPTSGDFGGPFSPAFGFSAGETSTGAAGDTLIFSFVVKAVNNVADGSRLEIDLGSSDRDDRYNFMALEYTAGGLRLVQNTPQADGNWQSNNFDWGGNVQLGALLDASVEHSIRVVFRAVDGSNNDIIEYYVDGVLVGTGSTFENFAEFHVGQPHASAINSVNNVLFRAGDPAGNPFPADGPGGNRLGFYIDDLTMAAFDSQQLRFDANNPAYDHLAVGQTQLVTVNYNLADGHGGLTPTSTVITVTGTNDGPVAIDDTNSAIEDAPVLTGSVASNDSDIDDGETATLAYTLDAPVAGLTLNLNGSYSFNPANAAYQNLAAGQTLDIVANYTVKDAQNATDAGVLTITITGINDAPTSTLLANDTRTWTEGNGLVTLDVLGNATLSDIDSADFNGGSLTVSINSALTQDILGILNTAIVTTAGNIVSVNGTEIGTFSGGGAGSPLVFAFNADATVARVQLMIRAIGYTNSAGDSPTAGLRTISWSFNDGDGDANGGNPTLALITRVNVVPVNDPPEGADVTVAINEDQVYYFSTADFAFSDTDGHTPAGVRVETSPLDGTLYFDPDGNGPTAAFEASPGLVIPWSAIQAGNFYYVPAANDNGIGADSFTFAVVDSGGAADATPNSFTFDIAPINDPAIITGDATGDVTEAGGVANGSPGTPTDTGDLDASDVDNTSDGWQAVSAGAATANGYGTYALSATGVWVYTLNNNNAAVQALNGAATLTDSFTALTQDGTSQVITVTIHAQNDAAVITGAVSGSVTEAGGVANGTPGTPTATGNLDSTDVDNTADAWQAVAAGGTTANGYGSYQLSAAGVWIYTLNNSNAAVQALNVGGTLTDSFTALTADGTSQLVTVTINGANDAAVITGTAAGDVTEAGGVANGTPGTPSATGDLDSTDVDNTADAWQAVSAGAATANGYGTYALSATGVWVYTLDNNNAAVQALNGAATLTDTFTVLTQDGTSRTVTVTIHAQNDAAVITGTVSGSVTEAGGVANGTPGTPTATGNLDSTDVDNPADAWQAVAAGGTTANGYGSYQLSAAGVWIYTLNNSNAAVQALNVGGTLTDTFTALTADGTAQLVTVTINGANDAAVITGTAAGDVTEAGGVANGTPGTPSATGDLDASDVDNTADAWQAVSAGAATANGYGTYALSATGVWVYTLNNNNAAVQALNGAATLTDSFTVLTQDGTSQVITVTIHAQNDAAVITGTSSGSVTEAGGVANATPGTPTATGNLDSTDVDNPADAWQAVGAGGTTANGYGSYQLTAAGVWTYTLDNNNPAVQALTANTTDSFTVFTADGTAQVVTITVNAGNDAPTAAVAAASATEQVTVNLDGVITVNDVDSGSGQLSVDVVVSYGILDVELSPGGVTVSGVGSSGVRITGTLAQIQAFLAGAPGNRLTYRADTDNPPATATLSVTVNDNGFSGAGGDQIGTAMGTITITAVNDPASISGTSSGSVTEAGGVANGTPGTPSATGNLDATDPDNATDSWQAVAAGGGTANGYGSYQLSAAGVWTYTLDNNNAAVQALNVGGTLTDSFTALTADGTAQLVTVTINGANDAAVITGDAAGNVTEAGGLANGAPGTPTDTGDLAAADVDNASDAWQAVAAGAATTNGYGTYALTAAGVWAYTLDNNNAAVQALNGAATLTDSFTAVTADGTTRVVTVTIAAQNDVPALDLDSATAGQDFVASYTENGAPVLITPNALVSDVDSPNFAGGTLGVFFASNGAAGDSFSIISTGSGPGQISTSGNNVLYEGVVIATGTHGSGSIVLTLNANATAAGIQALLRQVAISSTRDSFAASSWNVSIELNDGDGSLFEPGSGFGSGVINIIAVDDAPVARPDAFIALENAVLSGSVFPDNGSGADSDADGPALQVGMVNGSAVNVGTQIVLASGALLTVNADGTFSYNPNGVFNALPDFAASGASNTTAPDSFTYALVGGNTVTVTLTIRGVDSDDTLLGTAGADILSGGIGNDTISGFDGADYLDGGTGTDVMTGGAGDDTYIVDASGDVVIEGAGGGNDRIITSVSYALGGNSFVETLEAVAGVSAINLTGNYLAQTLIGNNGANQLHGGGGADTLIGLGGNDIYFTDVAAVQVVEAIGGGFDLLYTSVSYVLGFGSEVEYLAANDSAAITAINLTGNAFGQTLLGNNGANQLHGGGGVDVLIGLGGNDIYYTDVAATQPVEAVGGGFDLLYTSVSYVLGSGEIELLSTNNTAGTGAINLTGNYFNQTLVGNEGANQLNGGGGVDVLIGYGGNDIYFTDVAATQPVEALGGGFDQLYTSVSYALLGFSEIELLSTNNSAGTGAINLTGNVLNQTIVGNEGVNVLHGGGGVDVLIGYGGNDIYNTDVAATQAIEGIGGGNDQLYTSVSYVLAAGSEIELVSANDASSTAAINLTGNQFGQLLLGNAGANLLDGKGGADTLAGYGGADTFAFTSALGGGNVDVIADFQTGVDKIALDDAIFTALGLGALSANAFVIGSAALDADDRIIYNASNGALYYDADGAGGQAAIQFATLSGAPALVASDFTVI